MKNTKGKRLSEQSTDALNAKSQGAAWKHAAPDQPAPQVLTRSPIPLYYQLEQILRKKIALLITGQFGRWATPIAKDTGWVSQTPLPPIRHSWIGPVISNMQGVTIKAKAYKVSKGNTIK